MAANKTEPIALTETRSIDAYKHDADNIEEVVIARLTEEEIFKLSEEAFSWKSMAALRIVGIMFVQGCNQAGYGVDWGVISGIVGKHTPRSRCGLMLTRRRIPTNRGTTICISPMIQLPTRPLMPL